MKKWERSAVTVAMLLCICPLTANSSPTDAFTASDLYESCRGSKGPEGKTLCVGYVGGIIEMATALHSVSVLPPTFNYALVSSQTICMPSVGIETAVAAFVDYVHRNSNGMSRIPSLEGVLMALRATWPCRR
jgi:hypothetical protein